MCKSYELREDMLFSENYKYFSMVGEFSAAGGMEESDPISSEMSPCTLELPRGSL